MPIPEPVEGDLARVGGIEGLTRLLPDGETLALRSQQFHALSDPVRLKILLLLAVQPLCVCVIREVVAVADSRLSYHLNVLKKAGLIAGESRGNWIIYSLTAEGEKFAALLAGQGRA
ncbi:metalloregulator ArsR/SmtB family transcription factor [Methanofollis sp. UBA420]|jgi:ArsR family transcriptional regulator|uniref:ArsR/SmtB family transcription factor n=1 Tax=Methanofollis sp. UBA420 TaxID=1915514 RepID=UPI00316ADCD4